MPAWNGNEFLLPGGDRPTIRTLTPRRVDADELELDVEIVVHGNGIASRWAASATPGTRAAISGPGRGYTIDRDAPPFVLAGDETAIPAMSQLLELLPAETPVAVHVEVARPDARLALPGAPVRHGQLARPPRARTARRCARRRDAERGHRRERPRLGRRRSGSSAAHPPQPLRGPRDGPHAGGGARLLEARPGRRHRRRLSQGSGSVRLRESSERRGPDRRRRRCWYRRASTSRRSATSRSEFFVRGIAQLLHRGRAAHASTAVGT